MPRRAVLHSILVAEGMLEEGQMFAQGSFSVVDASATDMDSFILPADGSAFDRTDSAELARFLFAADTAAGKWIGTHDSFSRIVRTLMRMTRGSDGGELVNAWDLDTGRRLALKSLPKLWSS